MWERLEMPIVGQIELAHIPRWLRLGAVLAALALLCLAIGLVASRGNLLLLAAILVPPVGIMAAIGAVRYFDTLILVFPVSALALRFATLPTGSASPLPISLVLSLGLVAIWVFSMFHRHTWKQIPETCFRWPLFLFMLVCLISLPWGILWRDPILNMRQMGNFIVTQVGSLASLIISMCVPFLIGHFVDKPWKIRFYLGAFIICGTLMTITQTFGITQPLFNDRGLWGLWYVGTLFGLLIAIPKVSWWQRLLIIGLIGFNLNQTLIHSSLWISGWLPTVVGMIAMIFLRSGKVFIVIIISATLFLAVGPGRSFIDEVTQDNIDEGGLERLELWQKNLGLVAQHWLLGMGPAGYAPYNMTYFPEDARSTHNNYFDILAQFGVVGLGLWLVFMGASCWEGWRTVQAAPAGLLRATAIIATGGWVASLVSMMLGDWILPFAYNQGIGGYGYTVYSWIFLGLLLSVRRLTKEAAVPAQSL